MKFDLIVVNILKLNRKQLEVTCSCKQSGYILVDFLLVNYTYGILGKPSMHRGAHIGFVTFH